MNKDLLGKYPFVKDVEIKATLTFLDKNGEKHSVDTTFNKDAHNVRLSPSEDVEKIDVDEVFLNVGELIEGLQDHVAFYEKKVGAIEDDKLSI